MTAGANGGPGEDRDCIPNYKHRANRFMHKRFYFTIFTETVVHPGVSGILTGKRRKDDLP